MMKAKLIAYTIINGHQATHRFECDYDVETQEQIDKYKAYVSKVHNLQKKNRQIEDSRNRYRILFTIKKPKGCTLHT